ncbi:glycosyltransferase, partial [Desulfovibrio piger]|nr:glycosyltransferase [Desulfovibrio piger]
VREALSLGKLRLVGDDGWRDVLPGAPVEPPVDYYAGLSELYAGSGAVLNVTSLLLPHSLSQRHFDAWAAHGLLLSDATPGLEIFPASLTDPMRLRRPADLAERLEAFAASPEKTEAFCAAWREELRARHSYARRLQTLWRLREEDGR